MCALLNTAVFCTSLISCFPVMLLGYGLNYFEMVLVAPIIRCIYNYYFVLLLSLFGPSAPFQAITTNLSEF